jgi:restriction system protein
MMPREIEIQLPLLKCLEELGGSARPQELYPRIKKCFPGLTEADIAETLPSGGNKWTNRVQWVRQRLVSKGEIASPSRGVWAITDKGRKRLAAQGGLTTGSEPLEGGGEREGQPPINLEELADEYFSAFKVKVLQKLQDLSPKQFERFAGALLSAYGFTEIRVTGRSSDGGIDGSGKLKVGLARMNVAFQCKRWQGLVGRPEIDKFRGAIQGEFEQGIFFTTSDFSGQAQEASIKKGAAPVVLLNGDAIVQLMVEKGLGIQRRPVEVYEDQIETLFEEEG